MNQPRRHGAARRLLEGKALRRRLDHGPPISRASLTNHRGFGLPFATATINQGQITQPALMDDAGPDGEFRTSRDGPAGATKWDGLRRAETSHLSELRTFLSRPGPCRSHRAGRPATTMRIRGNQRNCPVHDPSGHWHVPTQGPAFSATLLQRAREASRRQADNSRKRIFTTLAPENGHLLSTNLGRWGQSAAAACSAREKLADTSRASAFFSPSDIFHWDFSPKVSYRARHRRDEPVQFC